MAKKYTEEEYAKILPKKIVGTAVIFFNAVGELLVVKPSYRDGWLIPGGVADDNEAPLRCATRETKEEIGLDVPDLKLVGIYHGLKRGPFTDSIKFVFYGGILTVKQISEIRLQVGEIEEYRFVVPETAIPTFSSSLKGCMPGCLESIKNGTVAYIEAV